MQNFVIDNTFGIRYLVINDINISNNEKEYEYRMITGNDIPVFLRCEIRSEDEKESVIYNIDGLISLKELSERNKLKYEEIGLLVLSIRDGMNAVRDYLLSWDGLILNPEYIFYNPDEMSVKFCFYPNSSIDVFANYTKLSEYLLLFTDYDDDSAVKLVYEIYAAVLNKKYDLYNLISDEHILNNASDTIKQNEEDREGYTETMQHTKMLQHTAVTKLSMLSVVCIFILVITISTFVMALFIKPKPLINLFHNTRVSMCFVIFVSLLIYFPVMNISDMNRTRRNKSHLVTKHQL